MIELTVKTLDSRNHGFTVADDTTVQQLKAKIQETMTIPSESQRLIYCGRVMQDDKKLAEYDVNGKVIHLVKCAPPQPGRRPGDNSGNSSSSPNNMFRRRGRRVDGNGNTMHIGSVVFPVPTVQSTGVVVGDMRDSGRAWMRMRNIEGYIQWANEVLDALENPNAAASSASAAATTQTASTSTTQSTAPSATTTPYNSSRDSSGSHSPSVDAQQSGSAGLESRAPASQNNDTEMTELASKPVGSTDQSSGQASTSSSAETESTTEKSAPASSTSTSGSTSAPGAGASQDGGQRRSSSNNISTRHFATIMGNLNTLHNRLSPFLALYNQLLRDDPPLTPENPQITAERQSLANAVPEIFHLLSHAYHAISDLTVDMESAPPRQMRVPPTLVMTTRGTTTIPLTFTRSMNAPPSSSSGASAASAGTDGAQTGSETTQASAATATVTASLSADAGEIITMTTTFPAEGGEATTTTTTRRNPAHGTSTSTATSDTPGTTTNSQRHQSQQSRQTGQPRTEPIAVPLGMFDLPDNVEFFMEVGPSSITIDSVEPTVVTSGNFSGTGSADTNSMGMNFPWGSPPPQEVIDSVMQAVGHIINSTRLGATGATTSTASNSSTSRTAPQGSTSGASTTAASSASPSTGNPPGSTPPGQNSQARGYTATHPTTSTQTRSTARPHVHIAAAQIPGIPIDPFLACSSHHLRSHLTHRLSRANIGFGSTPSSSAPVNNSSSRSTTASASTAGTNNTSGASATNGASNTNSGASTTSAASSPPLSGFAAAVANTVSPLGVALMSTIPQQMNQSSVLNFVQSFPLAAGGPVGNMDSLASLLGAFGPTLISGSASPGGSAEIPVAADTSDEDQEEPSILSHLRLAVVRSITMSDLVSLTMGQWDALNHIRTDLQRFVLDSLLLGEPLSEGNVNLAVLRLLDELQPHFETVLEARLRDDIDAVASLNRYHRTVIPDFLRLILDEERASNFGTNMYQMISGYLSRLGAIILHCCSNQEEGLETTFRTFINRLTNGFPLATWTSQALLAQVGLFTDGVNIPLEEIQPYLVRRDPATGGPDSTCKPQPETAVSPSQEVLSQENAASGSATSVTPCVNSVPSAAAASVDSLQKSRGMTSSTSSSEVQEQDIPPMETDPQSPPEQPHSFSASSTSAIQKEENTSLSVESTVLSGQSSSSQLTSGTDMDTDAQTPIRPEPWHSVLPPEWVPIITRDATRQRRSIPQAPLSDAYLNGMPPKRRKVVTASKPQGSLGQVISANMEHAIQASGVSTAGISVVQEAAGSDQVLQEAYREQLRATVRANLANNPDFSAERFPNAARYFGKS